VISNLTRRSALRGAAVGALGLGGAALLGCGGGDDSAGSASNTGGTSGADSGAPRNVKRADGHNPALGEVAINTKKIIKGGTYRESASDTSRENDPDVSIAGADWQHVADRLVIANGWTMKIEPDMLTSYELVDKAGLEMVFKLRPGIKTHNKPPLNGRIYTAKDVAFSIQRKAGKLDPKTAQSKYARVAQFDGLDKAEAVDDVTVKLTFHTPNGSIMQALSDPRAQMISPENEQVGFKDPMKFAGTGAWMEDQYLEGARQVFKRFPDYYRSWDEGHSPSYDAYEKIVISDRASILAAYISNQISHFGSIRPEEEPQLKSSAKDSLYYLWPGPTWDLFAMNLTLPNGMFKDARVRTAFMLALDYPALNNPLGKGWTYSAVTHSQFPESFSPEEVSKMPGFNTATKAADVAEAHKMMEAAGHKEGVGLAWDQVNNGNQVTDNNVRVRDMLVKLWPKMDVKLKSIADYASATNVLNNKEFQARTWNHTRVADAAIDARTYHHTDGGRNYQGYSTPWADELLNKLILAQTLQERRQLVRDLTTRYLKEGPCLIMLRVPPENSVVHGNVGGYDLVSGTWAYPGYVVRRSLWQTEA
jgi:peptide/nickel transport system substrate-binding protein